MNLRLYINNQCSAFSPFFFHMNNDHDQQTWHPLNSQYTCIHIWNQLSNADRVGFFAITKYSAVALDFVLVKKNGTTLSKKRIINTGAKTHVLSTKYLQCLSNNGPLGHNAHLSSSFIVKNKPISGLPYWLLFSTMMYYDLPDLIYF